MEFKFNINPDGIDEVFDERGNTVLKISEMSWNDRAYKLLEDSLPRKSYNKSRLRK